MLSASFRFLGLFIISFYRVVMAPSMGGVCRFEPSCSRYAEKAFQDHPPLHALKLSLIRLWRCRPGGGFGFDPVPVAEGRVEKSLKEHQGEAS